MGVPCPSLTPLAEASGLGKGPIRRSEGDGGTPLAEAQAWARGRASNRRGLGVPCPAWARGIRPGLGAEPVMGGDEGPLPRPDTSVRGVRPGQGADPAIGG